MSTLEELHASPSIDGTVCPRVSATPQHSSFGVPLNDLASPKNASCMPFDAAFDFVAPLFKLRYSLLAEPFFQCNTANACCISGGAIVLLGTSTLCSDPISLETHAEFQAQTNAVQADTKQASDPCMSDSLLLLMLQSFPETQQATPGPQCCY